MTSLPIGRWGSVALLLAGLACLGSASTGQASLSAADATSHLTALLAGVETIVGPGSPGGVVAFGAKAFPVVAGGQGPRDAVVAAAEWERGRVVILGHTGYLDPANFGVRDTATFLRNLLFWTGNKSKPRVLVLGNNALVDWLQQQGLTAAAGQPRGWANQLAGVDVLIGKENEFSSPEHRTAAERFARRGGGLILASTGWGWLQLNPGKNLSRDHPGNRLLVRAGLAWSGQFVGKTDRDGFKTAPVPETMLHAGRALDAFEKQSQLSADERRQAQHTLSATIAVLPAGEPIIVTRMRELRRRHGDAVIPTAKKPIRSDDGLKRLLVAWDVHQLLALPVEEIKAHPAAAEFPGSVPPAARPETRTLTVDTSIPGWHSTG
ncbi:MAG TPA: hypothetical protein PKC45_03880, partial [Gemmatales bacterium]|nr:hypothetical protein [Gemmatales bacterium]